MAIAEFPVELILEIVSHLSYDGHDHTNLAFTCRHIYATLLPGILENRVRCLRRSACRLLLYSYDKNAKRQPFGGSYRLLQLQLGDSKQELLFIQSLITCAKDLDAVHIGVGDRKTSIQTLAAIINTCATRPTLSLTVSGTIPWHHKFDDEYEIGNGPFKFEVIDTARPETYAKMFISFLKELPLLIRRSPAIHNAPPQVGSGAFPRVIAVHQRPNIKLSLEPQYQLSSLRIANDNLFSPSLYPLTKNLLNTAKITKLILSNLKLKSFAWTEILPELTLPTLQEFYVGNVSIAFPDLLTFLGRRCHQSIEMLDFTDNDAIGAVKISPLSILSQLSSLTASAEYLVPFLQSRNEGNFPALRYLGISAPRAL